MDRQKTLCLQCSEELQGRSDKKFCNVQCKSGYNNMARSDDEKNIQYINKAIRRNRTILLFVLRLWVSSHKTKRY